MNRGHTHEIKAPVRPVHRITAPVTQLKSVARAQWAEIRSILRGPTGGDPARQQLTTGTSAAAIRPQLHPAPAPVPLLQRKCKSCEEENHLLQEVPTELSVEGRSVDGAIQAAGLQGIPEVPVRLPGHGGGTEMLEDVRAKMEATFGVDFSSVRIHEGPHAQAIGALAYTRGTDIHFSPGQYQPWTQRGQVLLGHELTHVVQQSQGYVRATTQAKGVTINDDVSLEREADEMGARAARGETGRRTSPGPIGIPADGLVTQQAVQSVALIVQCEAAAAPTNLQILKGHILTKTDKSLGDAYALLNLQWMKIMLELLAGLGTSELQVLWENADVAQKHSAIGEDGRDRVLSAVLPVYLTKPDADAKRSQSLIEHARKTARTINVNQRVEIVDWLKNNKGKSKAAIALSDILSQPLLSYVASGFDFSSRFFAHDRTLGFEVENKGLSAYTSDPYGTASQPATITDPAEKSFEKSDILFFSGHQYAQYKEPGVFTNDAGDSCFNISMLSRTNRKVKMVASTGCATICKDVAKIWKDKFPGAMILGYQFSAPLKGGIVANAFAEALRKKGPIDLSGADGRDKVRAAWKGVVLGHGVDGVEGGPGILYQDKAEIRHNDKWKEVAWDDKANECHYH